MKKQPLLTTVILLMQDGTLTEVIGWEFSHVDGAILRDNGKYSFILLMSGKKLYDFDTLDECVTFGKKCHAHTKIFFGTADMEDMFNRAGGREPFINTLQKIADQTRKSK